MSNPDTSDSLIKTLPVLRCHRVDLDAQVVSDVGLVCRMIAIARMGAQLGKRQKCGGTDAALS